MTDLANILLTAFVRHNIVAGREASQLEAMVYDIARQLRINKALDYRSLLRGIMPNDAEFEAAFKNLSPRRTPWGRYLIAAIEQSRRESDETLLGPSATLHVEHIYPKKPSVLWEDHAKWVNRLGNLTLLGRRLNTQASNSSFVEKKRYYEQSQIVMTKELAALPDWSPQRIDTRQTQLFSDARALWPSF
jgi:hypothetical protein